jgi:adenine-specific DNA methylase
VWEQLVTTKEQLDRANTMLISAESSVDELTSSASCASDNQAELQAEAEQLQAFVTNIEERGTVKGLTSQMQQLRRSYLHCAKQDGFHFDLTGVRTVCAHANDLVEWQRVQVVAGVAPLDVEKSLHSTSSAKAKHEGRAGKLQEVRGKRAAALWFLAIEGQSRRIHFMQDAIDTNVEMTQVGGSGLIEYALCAVTTFRERRSLSCGGYALIWHN